MKRTAAVLTLLALVALAGCNAPVDDGGRPDPLFDRVGWEDGHWYDDPISVSTEDGLTEREREAVVARAMARIEHLRGKEFRESVPVTVISRTEYSERYGGGGGRDRFGDQVSEALLLVGENNSTADDRGQALDASVQGFYSTRRGEIVLVSDSPTPTVDRSTLVHELVHALQQQRLSLGVATDSQDARRAQLGVVEGEANTLQRTYADRCDAEWDCIERPARQGGGGGNSNLNFGLFLTIYAPYAAGPDLVEAVRDRGGWAAVDGLYDEFPASTEQLIHPEAYPDETPASVTVADRSDGEWRRYNRTPAGDTAGEAAIYAMLWANGALDVQGAAVYDYDSRYSAGWAGDRIVPYRNGDQDGYVWAIEWDTTADAREFVRAYRAILSARASGRPAENVSVLPESDEFGDAFRVTRDGRRVRIVNGPTVDSLPAIGGDE
ncbi:Hvo_1808 family surface protein [Halorientalis sp.]|uniref:Hvo_1808 family surface protein n=1 Tax=Halorientalis sp. TaxID=1931229 RepID=UPI002617D612|nr:Hvo_1808 family surface protein [Halorientalis sp.]